MKLILILKDTSPKNISSSFQQINFCNIKHVCFGTENDIAYGKLEQNV